MNKGTIVSIPLYEKIYLELEKKIEEGIYKAGDRLPTEAELQKEFDVSRITIRRSILELEVKGYVERKQGIGTFVLPRRSPSRLGALGFTQETIQAGEIPSSIVLEFKKVVAPDMVSDFLEIERHQEVYYLKRLRLKSGRVVGMNEAYISNKLNINFEEEIIDEHTSLYELYDNNLIEIQRATETMEAVMPSETLRKSLYISDKEPVFRRTRITYNDKDIPIEYSINEYRAYEFKYTIELVL